MGKFLYYSLLGTAAALAILAGAVMFSGSENGEAEAREPADRISQSSRAQNAVLPIRRCMNMGGALEADNEGDWGYKIRKRDFAEIKRAGFDTVRVPIKFSAHTGQSAPYTISPELFKRVDEIIDWAIIEGLQIIIDVHHYEELMSAPQRHEKRLEAMWEQIAYRYATAPDNLFFELINEPNDKMTITRTDQLNKRLMRIVRQHNPKRWVIVGSAGWGGLDALLKSSPPREPNVMTTFHYYDPFEFTHQGATWIAGADYPTGIQWQGLSHEQAAIRKDLDIAARWRDQTGLPMLLGEFGAIGKADDRSRARWAEVVRAESEKRNIGWCYWEWGTGFPAYDLKSERWVTGMKRALTAR